MAEHPEWDDERNMVRHSICVCVSKAPGIASWFIRFWSRSRVSHAFVTFRSQTLGKVFAMESTATGFRLTPWSRWKRSHTLIGRYRVNAPLVNQLSALEELSEYLGTRYDYKSLLGFFWRLFRNRMSNKYNSSKRLICSEAVALFLFKAGLTDFERPETWTPGDLYRAIEKDQRFMLVESSASSRIDP